MTLSRPAGTVEQGTGGEGQKTAPAGTKPKRYREKEAPLHKAVLEYLRWTLPGAVINHAANGISLGGSGAARARAMNKAKSEGMLVGYPDLVCLWRGQFFAFEVKPAGRKPTEAQSCVGAMIEKNGGRWAVVRSVEDAAECLREWRGDLP